MPAAPQGCGEVAVQPFRDELFRDQQRRNIIAESTEEVLLILAEVTCVTCIVQNLQRKLAVAARCQDQHGSRARAGRVGIAHRVGPIRSTVLAMLFNSMSAGDTPEYVRPVVPDASWCLASLVTSRNCGAGCSRLVIRCSAMIDGSKRRAMRWVSASRRV